MSNILINTVNPEVSVIITVYNRVFKFKRALKSLIDQSFSDFEVIIIDDGSKTDLSGIISEFSKKIDNLKYLRHSNRNTALSLNTGLRIASGKYITFLDSDDEYQKNHINLRYRYLNNNPGIDLIHSPAKIIGKENNMYVPDADDLTKMIHIENCIIGATFFGKSEVFKRLNGFKNIYSYDYEFYNRACKLFNVRRYYYRTYIYYRTSKDSVINILKKNLNR